MNLPRILRGNKRKKFAFVTFVEKKDDFNWHLQFRRETRISSSGF